MVGWRFCSQQEAVRVVRVVYPEMQSPTAFCKTLGGSARLAACPANFYWNHRQMQVGGKVVM